VIKTILIFIVLANVIRTELRLKVMFWLVLIVSIYLSISLIHDYQAGIFKIGAAETNTQRVAGAIKGLFENSNDLALHLVTIIPITIALGLVKKNPLMRIVYWGIGFLMVAAVVITFSRGGFLALIAMTVVLSWKFGRRNKNATLATCGVGSYLLRCAGAWRLWRTTRDLFSTLHRTLPVHQVQRTVVLKRSIWVGFEISTLSVSGWETFTTNPSRSLARTTLIPR
jgi:ABC-type nickel/cobalt efflux system permease component RcnA